MFGSLAAYQCGKVEKKITELELQMMQYGDVKLVRFEWLLNLNSDACGELDDAGSIAYFKKITVTPDDERAWFKKHPQWEIL